MEYNNVLDTALDEASDSLRRLAKVAAYSATFLTVLERSNTKPFNPLLGETYEFFSKGFKFIAEQVSHLSLIHI